MSRGRTQLPDKPTTKGPGLELVAWLPFENRHADPGSVLVCVLQFLWKATLPLACMYVLGPLSQQKKICYVAQ